MLQAENNYAIQGRAIKVRQVKNSGNSAKWRWSDGSKKRKNTNNNPPPSKVKRNIAKIRNN